MPTHHSGASPPPLRTLRSLLAGIRSCNFVAPLSPRAGPHSFPARANLHGWHVTHGIVYQFGRVHIALVAEARSDLLLPSDPVSQHRTGIVSSSLDPGSTAERISSSLALCPTFDLASALSSGSNFGWSLFFCLAGRTSESAWQHFPLRVCVAGRGVRYSSRPIKRCSWHRSSKVRCFG